MQGDAKQRSYIFVYTKPSINGAVCRCCETSWLTRASFRRFEDIGANVRFERATRASLSDVIRRPWSIRFPQHFRRVTASLHSR
jgi:hypothetical protein